MREYLRDPVQLRRIGKMAEKIAEVGPEGLLRFIARTPPGTEGLDELRSLGRALRGAELHLNGDPEGAFAEWSAAIEETPEEAAPLYVMRGLFRVMRGELEEALDDMNHALTLEPSDARTYTHRGDIHRHLGRDAAAMANYRRAAQLDRDDFHARSGLAQCLLDAEEFAEALIWYTQAVRLRPKDVDVRLGRAICLENLDRRPEAIAELDSAIRLAPEDADLYLARGRCRQPSQPDEAFADFSRATELDPEDIDGWTMRAQMQVTRGAFDAGIADASRAIEVGGEDAPDAYFIRAAARHLSGEPAAALADYEEAARLDPDEPMFVEGRERCRSHLQRLKGRLDKPNGG